MACTEEDRYDFAIRQGDDEQQDFRYLLDGVAVDLTGALLVFECDIPALTHDMTIKVPETDGVFSAVFDRADTSGLSERRVGYEVVYWPTGLLGKKHTIFYGSLTLKPERIS